MKLAIFILGMRIRAYFKAANWKTLLLHAGFSLVGIFYVLIVSLLLDASKESKSSIKTATILSSLSLTVFVLPFILKFFPSFTPKKMLLSKHYPISNLGITVLDLIVFNFLRPVVLITTFCLLVLYFINSSFNCESALYTILYAFTGFLFAENMITSISWNRLLMILVSIIVVVPLMYLNFEKNDMLLFGSLIATILLQVIIQFRLYILPAAETDAEKSIVTKKAATNTKFLLQKISLRKPAFRTTMLQAFIIKIMILFFIIPFKTNELFTYTGNPVFIFAFVPIFPFTYIFNNAWGYFRSLTINIVAAGGGIRALARVYIKLLLAYLIIDLLLAMTAILIFDSLNFTLILAYFVCTLFSISIGLTGSLYKYFEVKKAMSITNFKPNTSPLINILTMLPAGFYIFLHKDTVLLTIILFFFLFLGVMLIIFLRRNEAGILLKFKSKLISG